MPFDNSLADRIRSVLRRRRNIVERNMFGGLAFLSRGHMLVGVWKETMIVRVGPKTYDEALSQPHARVCKITGRPMKGLVQIDAIGVQDENQVREWVAFAMRFVGKLPDRDK